MVEGKKKGLEEVKITQTTFIKENLGKFREFYKIGHVLGTGSYGQVRKCLHIRTKQIRSVKLISKDILDATQTGRMLDELEILRTLDHPNILKMYEYYQDDKRYYLVTEYCSGGELFDKIIEQMYMTEEEASSVIRQVMSAIAYCHARSIVHRDLKPENLLLDSKDKDASIKIIDFGTAQVFDPTQKMKQKSGTPYYIAPEVLKKEYDSKCDIWSAGVILFILLCGYPPFNGRNDTEIMKNVLKGKFDFKGENWEYISAEAKDLISKMLTYDPKKRIDAKNVLSHPWVQAAGDKEKAKAMKTKTIKTSLENLKNFRTDAKLRQAAMTYIVSQLMDEKEKKELQRMFKALDKDGNGMLDRQELIDGYEMIFGEAVDLEKIDEIFRTVDTDNSGFIDYNEFLVAAMSETKVMSNQNLREAFNLMDKDGNGSVDAAEIREVLGIGKEFSEEVWEQVVKEVDENGDGVISFEEFSKMMRKFCTQ